LKREHIGGLVALGIIAAVIYYAWKQPSGQAGVTLGKIWSSVQNALGGKGGGSRQVAPMPNASTMDNTPTYVGQGYNLNTNPAGVPASALAQPDQATLVAVLNAPVTPVIQGGGNNGDVRSQLVKAGYFVM